MDGTLPDPAEVKKRLALIGYKHLVLDKKKRTVFLKKKGMSITLGGIAKGYAVDKCVAAAPRARASSTSWSRPAATCTSPARRAPTPWVVGIRDPRGAPDAMFALAPIEDHSFSTSGDYERGFVKDGVRYHHILDPRDRSARARVALGHDPREGRVHRRRVVARCCSSSAARSR